MPGVTSECVVGSGERGFELCQLRRRALQLGADATRHCIAFASLFFSPLPT